jgi:class 3 adenylate cyclase
VNVASRIQSLGQANTILFSKEIFDKIRNQPEFKSVSLGLFEFKNVDQPMEVFALANEGLNVPKKETLEGKLKTHLSKSNNAVRKK